MKDRLQGRLSLELRERAKRFGSGGIRLFVSLPKQHEEVRILARQLIRSATSVAAHTQEASRARSNDEFKSKLGGALQEADESVLWLEYLREVCQLSNPEILRLEKEANEIIAIFTTIIKRTTS